MHTHQLTGSLLQLPTTCGRNNLPVHPGVGVHSVETLSLKPVSESRPCEAVEAEPAGRPCSLGALAWCWGDRGAE